MLPDRELESQTEKLQRRAAARFSSSSLLTVDPRVGGTVPLHQETGLNEGRAFYANAFVVFTFVQILLGSDYPLPPNTPTPATRETHQTGRCASLRVGNNPKGSR